MTLSKPCRRWLGLAIRAEKAPASRRRGGARPGLEPLEDRTVLSSYTASSVEELIGDINAANTAGGSNTITLAPGKTFTRNAVDNTTDGATGLPVIAGGDNLTIVGNGDTIARSTAKGTPEFRLLDVASGASLSLSNLTLQGGVASGSGGAIMDWGSLSLSGVTVRNNVAKGDLAAGGGAAGGGIAVNSTWVNGVLVSAAALTAQDSTLSGNQALGAHNTSGYGGQAWGGGLYVGSGVPASLTNVTVSSNIAQGGGGGGYDSTFTKRACYSGGDGFGGGMYVYYSAASVELRSCTMTGNSALGGKGQGGASGVGVGGGLYIDPFGVPPVCLDAFTVAHIASNKASTDHPNI